MAQTRSRPDPKVPPIDPLPSGIARPFWSVMLPTYNPSPLFEETLRSVLDQDPGPDQMQIAVVDDCSPKVDVETLLRRLDPVGRVEWIRNPTNVGLAGNWNACVRAARGRWVHLLHQDDLVRPGFYERLALADAARPEVGAAFCRHDTIDTEGHHHRSSELERSSPGVLEDWHEWLASGQRIECPSIVVRRDVYERLGGFRSDLVYALDWEMWARIAAQAPFWYEPESLACYRSHDLNETARLCREGLDLADEYRAGREIIGNLPRAVRRRALRRFRRRMALRQLYRSAGALEANDLAGALDPIRRALAYDWTFVATAPGRAYGRWTAKVGLRRIARMMGQWRPGRLANDPATVATTDGGRHSSLDHSHQLASDSAEV